MPIYKPSSGVKFDRRAYVQEYHGEQRITMSYHIVASKVKERDDAYTRKCNSAGLIEAVTDALNQGYVLDVITCRPDSYYDLTFTFSTGKLYEALEFFPKDLRNELILEAVKRFEICVKRYKTGHRQ